MPDFRREALCYDPLHGYMPLVSNEGLAPGEVSERQIIDHPWLQRLRQIHQLANRLVGVSVGRAHAVSARAGSHAPGQPRRGGACTKVCTTVCPDVPSRGYVEWLLRMAGLLHDVGHGPFGHFFDEHFLSNFGLTHETLGSAIIERELGDLIRGVRRNPNGALEPQTKRWIRRRSPMLITRPKTFAGGGAQTVHVLAG